MLNEEKIILMTKLAIYEKGEGKKEIPMSKYYQNDYVGVHMLYTFISVTLGYILLAALYVARDVEEFLSSLTTMDLRSFLFTAVALYVIALVFSLFVTWIVYRRRFKKNRVDLNEYYGHLKKLKKLQKKEQDDNLRIVEGRDAGEEPKFEFDEEPDEPSDTVPEDTPGSRSGQGDAPAGNQGNINPEDGNDDEEDEDGFTFSS